MKQIKNTKTLNKSLTNAFNEEGSVFQKAFKKNGIKDIDGFLKGIVAGNNINIDYTNPLFPIIHSTGGGGGIISVTHAQALSLIGANDLKVGSWYRITDFASIYKQPVTDITKTGATEPLLLLAIADDKFHTVARSEDYPNDIIHYDITYVATDVNAAAAKGLITFRKDDKGNSTDFDFRNVEFFDGVSDKKIFDFANVIGNVQMQNQRAVRTSLYGVGLYFPNVVFKGTTINIVNSNITNAKFEDEAYSISNAIISSISSGGAFTNVSNSSLAFCNFDEGVNMIVNCAILTSSFAEKIEYLSDVFIFNSTFDKRITGITSIEIADTTCNCFIVGLRGGALSGSNAVKLDTCTITGASSTSNFGNITVNCVVTGKTIDEASYPELFNIQIHKEIYMKPNGDIFYRYLDNSNVWVFTQIV